MFYEIAEKALALEKKGKKITRLNVGDTGLPTPRCAIEAAEKSMEKSGSGYGSSAGLLELRQAIARREGCEVENVVVGNGSKHLLFALMSTLAIKKRTVAFPSPYWPAYALACRQLGLKIATAGTLLEKKWQFDSIPDADLAIICNPLNPTSTIFEDRKIKQAISEAEENGMHIVLDEAYRGIAFEEMPKYENAIRVRSFSKEFNMENWRLGYLVAPQEIAAKVVQFNQITETCVPSFVQMAGVACIENEKEILSENCQVWRARAGAASKALRKAGFRFAEPQSAMYVFATHDGIADSDAYAIGLLENGVAVASGKEFGGFKKFVRICANREEGVLEEAIGKMGEAASLALGAGKPEMH